MQRINYGKDSFACLLLLFMLLSYKNSGVIEAGCDEAGRGCLAGPVYAAAVILPPDFEHELISDSKKLSGTAIARFQRGRISC